jgi:lipopolysaccharide/colanic/teichoic acid biosynthesis glycosyltransferase
MDRPAGTSTGTVRAAERWHSWGGDLAPGMTCFPGATGHSTTVSAAPGGAVASVAGEGVGYGWPVESVAGTNGDRPVAVRPRPAALALKRTLDATLAAAGLVVLSPVLAALAAVILVEDGLPVLFRQERAGLDGEPFTILKFRTMVRDAEAHGDGFAVNEGDDRILRTGDFYRRFGLDELPQLWNVLRGDMSLIGPRPTLMQQVDRYTPRQRVRLRMRPGVTGWSQIHGRTSIPWSRRIELDVWYVEHWSLRLDARILLRTFGQMTRPGDTYKGTTGGWDL